MDERILKWLYDIKSAIEEIESYFVDIPKDFNQYSSGQAKPIGGREIAFKTPYRHHPEINSG